MIKKIAFLGTAMVMATAMATPAAAQFKSAVSVAKTTQDEAKRSQQTIDRLDDQTAELLNEYRANLKQFELLTRFNETRKAEIENQERQIVRIGEDIENVASLQLAMVPLMEDMLADLEEFVAADMPFDEESRDDRITRLRGMMDDSSVSAAQRYNLILEALRIELEYGRTVEWYADEVETEDGGLSVEVLRVGRLALIYKTADDSILRIYNPVNKDWEDLPKSFLDDVRLGFRVAKRQTAPTLLTVPVKAPTPVQ